MKRSSTSSLDELDMLELSCTEWPPLLPTESSEARFLQSPPCLENRPKGGIGGGGGGAGGTPERTACGWFEKKGGRAGGGGTCAGTILTKGPGAGGWYAEAELRFATLLLLPPVAGLV